ncbi:hypothetical protein JCM10212_006455 [Sporobolomyces blumeae]
MSAPPPVPPELKPITPYLARAHELSKADPVIAYWCTYFALQQAMTLGAQDPESQAFLFSLMDKLEAMKAENSDNDAVTEDAAAAAYIENFGIKIFSTADNEDRRGKATRATAKKFLAAANFLELLSVFGEVGTENREKIKYSKWKATDIAKAFREGRNPTPGPAGGLPEGEDVAEASTQVTADEAKELSRELAALGTAEEGRERSDVGGHSSAESVRGPASIKSPTGQDEGESSSDAAYPFPQQPTTLPSARSPSSTPPPPPPDFVDDDPSRIPTPSLPPFVDTSNVDEPRSASSVDYQPFVVDPNAHVPASHQTSDLPAPASGAARAEPPAFPSAVFPPTAPTASSPPPPPPSSAPRLPVPTESSCSAHTGPRPLAPPPGVARDSYDPLEVAKIQKHAKWAISALNYEDYETARKELRLALTMLGG